MLVPNLVGLSTQDAAKASLEAQGLKLGEVGEMYSDSIEKGKVAKQDVDAKSKVPQGTTVNIWISKGPEEKPKVPNLVGRTEDEAKALLKANGLEAGEAKSEYSDTVANGKIISQTVQADSTVEKGSSVGYTVSKGPKPTEKPSETTPAAKTVKKNISRDNLNIPADITSGELIADIEVKCSNKTENYSQNLGNYEGFSTATINQSVDSTAQSATITVKLDGTVVYTCDVVFN